MIEIVYKEEDTEESGLERILRLPKNIRQIGEPGENRKIYVEDYVITYLRQYAKKDLDHSRAALLLGEAGRLKGAQYIFVRSAMEIQNVQMDHGGVRFTDEVWTDLYANIKKYFDNQEIVGWFLSMPGFPLEMNHALEKNHMDNFAGVDKILMLSEPTEEEEGFFVYHGGSMVKQRGYYVFYERNEQMQNYMIECRGGESVEAEQQGNEVIRNFRSIIQEKKEISNQRRMMAFLYTASTFLIMVVLVIGITMLNNYDKMEKMEMAINQITVSLEDKQEAPEESAPQEELEDAAAEPATEPAEETVEAFHATEEEKKPEPVLEETLEEKKAEVPEPEQAKEQPEEQPQAAVTPQYYQVEKGDTLAGISRKIYGTDARVAEICALNELENGDVIFAGEKILLP